MALAPRAGIVRCRSKAGLDRLFAVRLTVIFNRTGAETLVLCRKLRACTLPGVAFPGGSRYLMPQQTMGTGIHTYVIALSNDKLESILIPVLYLVVLVCGIALVLGLIWILRRFLPATTHALAKILAELEVRDSPTAGDVEIQFNVYRGLLGSGYQTRITGFLKPGDARHLLDRLHRFNLTWGVLATPMVIPCSISELRRERRSIAKQEAEFESPESPASPAP